MFFRTEATSETDKVDGLISASEEKVLLLYIDSVFKGASLFAKNATGFYLVYYTTIPRRGGE